MFLSQFKIILIGISLSILLSISLFSHSFTSEYTPVNSPSNIYSLQDLFELRINSGGSQFTYGDEVFIEDNYFVGEGKDYSNSNLTNIKNTEKDAIYYSERSTTKSLGSFGYSIPVPNGVYKIRLHFAEIYWGATKGGPGGAGKRVFSANLEGKNIFSNYDINKEVGSMTAVIKNYFVDIKDGELNLNFTASKDQPKISALEILQQDPESTGELVMRVNSGGPEIKIGDKIFEGDNYYAGAGKKWNNTAVEDIKNTTEDDLYLTERSALESQGSFQYAIPVSNGKYTIKLHFAEIYWGATGGGSNGSGKRVFDLDIEDNNFLSDYDLNEDMGTMTAVVKTFTTDVTDGELNLNFSASVDQPKISGFELFKIADSEDSSNTPIVRVNSGGGELQLNDEFYQADSYYRGDGKSYSNNDINDIKKTTQDNLYLSERSTTKNKGSFQYAIPITNGTYTVKLHFAEIYWGATNGGPGGSGKRVFNVRLENQSILSNYDINEDVGSMTAVVKSYSVDVNDQELNIDFTGVIDQPKLSGFEILGDGEVLPDPCTWNSLASSKYDKVESQSAKVNDKLYVFAGFEEGLQITGVTEIYDTNNNQWSLGKSMPDPVTHMGAVVVDDEVWIVAGFTGNHPGVATSKVQIYNTKTNNWRYGPSLPNPRGSGSAVYNEGKIHFFGGLLPDRKTDVGEHYILDLDNLAAGWKSAAPLPNGRNHLGGASVDGIVYAIGGQYGHDGGLPAVDDQKFLHSYNPATDKWTRLRDLPEARSHFEPGTIVHNGKIIIVGGRREAYFFDDITQYDPATNTWTQLCKLPSHLLAPSAKIFGDRLVVTNGGVNGESYPTNKAQWIPIEPETTLTSNNTFNLRGVEESYKKATLYPNPASDKVVVKFINNSDSSPIQITVRDIYGITHFNDILPNKENSSFNLDISTYNEGIYFVDVKQKSGSQVLRLIKSSR